MYITLIVTHSYSMSLVFVVKVPEGLVLAAESRKTVKFQDKKERTYVGSYDSTPKVLSFKRHNYVGAVTCGLAAIGPKPIHSYLPELDKYLKKERLSVLGFSEKLSAFFAEKWNAAKPEERVEPISFIVAGFDKADPYGKVYSFDIPSNSKPIEQGEGVFTLTFAGQKEVTYRLLKGYSNALEGAINSLDNHVKNDLLEQVQLAFFIPYQNLTLQDSIDLATFLIETTIKAQSFAVGERGCGGEIDVCIITPEKGLDIIKRKTLTCEAA